MEIDMLKKLRKIISTLPPILQFPEKMFVLQ